MAPTQPGPPRGDPPDPALAALLQEHDVPCPCCGYSLRGLTSDRCPECGLAATAPVVLRLRRRPATPAWWIGAAGLVVNIPLTVLGWCCFPAARSWIFLHATLQIMAFCLIIVAIMAEWMLLLFWFNRERSILNAPASARGALAAFVWWPAALLVVMSLI
jgi:hypothetical protein